MHIMKKPVIGKNVFIAEGAIVRGDVTIEGNCSIWFHATLRAEEAPLFIGSGSNVQDNCVIHTDADACVMIGKEVTVGHGAIVHGCTIGNQTLIGMGAVILNHAIIGSNCIIGAGALVTQNSVIPDGSVVLGNPGKVTRAVTPEEIDDIRRNASYYVQEAKFYAGLQ